MSTTPTATPENKSAAVTPVTDPRKPSAVPPSLAPSYVLKWAHEAMTEGEAFLRSSLGYDKIDETMNCIMSEDAEINRPQSLSKINVNVFGKIALDLVAALTDIKPFWNYKTYNRKFEQQADMARKLSRSWWGQRHISLKFSDVIKYAAAAGTGYGHIIWNEDMQDQDLIAEDPRDVLPIRPGSLYSIQEAFGVALRRERTVNFLKHMYPTVAHIIRPDRDGSYRSMQTQTRAAKLMSSLGLSSGFLTNLYASLGGRPKGGDLRVPTADVFTLYVKDDSLNATGEPQIMGDPSKNWSYLAQPGEPLYPRKRCIIFTRTAMCYDGPNIYWHGQFPTPKLTLDPWPWSWLGKAPLKDLLPLHYELQKAWRTLSEHNERVRRPGIAADKNSISRAAMERIDTSRSGLKLRHNPVAGKGVELLHEPPLDQAVFQSLTLIPETMYSLSGVKDLTQLMSLNQIPAAETIEKMLESMSLSIRLRSQVMEVFVAEFAMMVLSNFFQFYTVGQRVATLGPSGTTFEDADFDPGTLIPDFVHESDFDGVGNISNEAKLRGPLPRYERARTFLRNFTFHIAPGSLLAASGITEKLLYLQLFRMGIMDVWTLLEKLEVDNVGEPPEGATTITDRIKAMAAMGIQPQVSAVGRKASGQEMPKMKSSGAISESG